MIVLAIENSLPRDDTWDLLKIDGFRTGIRISAANARVAGRSVVFDLNIGYQLPFAAGERFGNVLNAMVMTVEQPETCRSGVIRLGEPNVRPAIPNFTGAPVEEEGVSVFGGQVGLEIVAEASGFTPNDLYLRVVMQRFVSNVVVLERSVLEETAKGESA